MSKAKKASAKKKRKPVKKKLEQLDLLVGNLTIENLLLKESWNNLIIQDSVCPVIVLKDESILYAEVLKLEDDSLTLQHCDSLKQKFRLSKSQIFKVDYEPATFDSEATKQEMQEGMVFEEGSEYFGIYEEEETERKAKLALILGLCSLVIWPLGIVVLVLVKKTLKRYKNIHPNYQYGKGLAIAALVLGILSTLWTAFLLTAIIVNILIWGI